jgi:hypothetical protein
LIIADKYIGDEGNRGDDTICNREGFMVEETGHRAVAKVSHNNPAEDPSVEEVFSAFRMPPDANTPRKS